MTPDEWDTSDDAAAMLDAVGDRASDRKLLLFALGCCRIAEPDVPSAAMLGRHFEGLIDGTSTGRRRRSLFTRALDLLSGKAEPLHELLLGGDQSPKVLVSRARLLLRATHASRLVPVLRALDAGVRPSQLDLECSRRLDSNLSAQAALLRELLGNPFQSVAFDPRWRTEAVVGLAAAIEEANAWDRLPIFADALQDAGCESPDVLDHCRDAGRTHARGCWVIDAALGRA